MKTLKQKFDVISEMSIDDSRGSRQFTPEQIEACDAVTEAILNHNLHGSEKPEIPEDVNLKLGIVQDMQLAEEAALGALSPVTEPDIEVT